MKPAKERFKEAEKQFLEYLDTVIDGYEEALKENGIDIDSIFDDTKYYDPKDTIKFHPPRHRMLLVTKTLFDNCIKEAKNAGADMVFDSLLNKGYEVAVEQKTKELSERNSKNKKDHESTIVTKRKEVAVYLLQQAIGTMGYERAMTLSNKTYAKELKEIREREGDCKGNRSYENAIAFAKTVMEEDKKRK